MSTQCPHTSLLLWQWLPQSGEPTCIYRYYCIQATKESPWRSWPPVFFLSAQHWTEQGLWSMQEEYTIHNVYSFPSPSERCELEYTVSFEHLCVVKWILCTALTSWPELKVHVNYDSEMVASAVNVALHVLQAPVIRLAQYAVHILLNTDVRTELSVSHSERTHTNHING